MRIEELTLRHGFTVESLQFDAGINLLTSSNNEAGKTLRLKLILQLLKSANYSKKELCLDRIEEIKASIQLDNKDICTAQLVNGVCQLISANSSTWFETYNPSKADRELLNRLLYLDDGMARLDKEKADALLVLSLNAQVNEEVVREIEVLKRRINRLKRLQKVADVEELYIRADKNDVLAEKADHILRDVAALEQQQHGLKLQLTVEKDLRDSLEGFVHFIDSLGMEVVAKDGTVLPVTRDNLRLDLNGVDLVNRRIVQLESKIAEVENKIAELKLQHREVVVEYRNINEFDSRRNVNVRLDNNIIQYDLEQCQLRLENLNGKFGDRQNQLNQIRDELEKNYEDIAKMLFTDHELVTLKDVSKVCSRPIGSGSILVRQHLAWRVAYLRLLYKYLGCRLPLFIEGQVLLELDRDNFAAVYDVMNNLLHMHQIFIATVQKEKFAGWNVHEVPVDFRELKLG